MNNILYVANFYRDNHTAPAIIYSLLNQRSICNIIGVLDESIIRDVFYNYFISYSSQLKLYTASEIGQALMKDIGQHDWLAFISNNCLYYQNYDLELKKLCEQNSSSECLGILPQNSKNIIDRTILIHKSKILKYLTTDPKFLIQYKTGHPITQLTSFESVSVNYAFSDKYYLYIDDYCIFGRFINTERYELLDSMVYINKSNNRVYNIVNNIIGYSTTISDDHISIEWQTDNINDPIINVQYHLDPSTQAFVAV